MGILFSAYDIRSKSGESETTEYMWNVGKAYADWLSDAGDVIAVKTENASTSIVNAVIEGMLLQGRNVVDGGVGNNSTIIGAIVEKKAAGGVLIDHNDLQAVEIVTLFDRNGVTVTADNGLNDVTKLLESSNFVPAPTKGELKK